MTDTLKKTLRTALPVLLGVFVFYWVYRDFPFPRVWAVLRHEVAWGWMLASLFFGVLSHVLRGWRWKQMLQPEGAHPRRSHCVYAVFLSYVSSMVVPRSGEVSRCGVLKRLGGVSFPLSLGTVVAERVVDALCVLLITAATFLLQTPLLMRFFRQTGAKIPSVSHLLSSPWFYVSLFCVVGFVVVLRLVRRRFFGASGARGVLQRFYRGLLSVGRVDNRPLFVLYTAGIWLCYFLHFYLTFHCFAFSDHLGLVAGLVLFTAGTFAVIVPTPNGAGPWHFAVITMMVLYGVDSADAALFALIVHAVQTLLVLLLGLWAGLALTRSKPQ